ncbi:MAG: hypothetical protein NTY20_03900 [Candidatus Aenigmarchaeota archaeon]|nr:hypothetical protein [Candidatus Aenigmarchaeota archaeon]
MKKYPVAEGKISLGGPEVDFLNNPYSDKRDLVYMGERNYDDPLVKDALEGVEKPKIEDSPIPRRVSKYVGQILRSLNERFMKEGRVKLSYRDLRIKEMPRREVVITEDGHIAEVLGFYDTESTDLYLSPYLKELDEKTNKKVLIEEIFHYAQHKLGIIGKYAEKYGRRARPAIELQAKEMVEEIAPEIYSTGYPWDIQKRAQPGLS